MTRATVGILGLSVSLASPGAAAGDAAQDLWNRAVEAASRSRHVMATTTVVTILGRDPAAGVACRREATLSLRGFDDEGKPDWDSVYTEDLLGKVPSEGVACEYAPGIKGEIEMMLPLDCSPLDDWAQTNVSYEETTNRREVGGTDCIVYEFEWKRSCRSRKPVLGEVCIDPAMALPLEVRYAYRSVPKGFRSVNFGILYEDLGDLGPNVVRFTVEILPKSRKGEVEPIRLTGTLTGHRRVWPE